MPGADGAADLADPVRVGGGRRPDDESVDVRDSDDDVEVVDVATLATSAAGGASRKRARVVSDGEDADDADAATLPAGGMTVAAAASAASPPAGARPRAAVGDAKKKKRVIAPVVAGRGNGGGGRGLVQPKLSFFGAGGGKGGGGAARLPGGTQSKLSFGKAGGEARPAPAVAATVKAVIKAVAGTASAVETATTTATAATVAAAVAATAAARSETEQAAATAATAPPTGPPGAPDTTAAGVGLGGDALAAGSATAVSALAGAGVAAPTGPVGPPPSPKSGPAPAAAATPIGDSLADRFADCARFSAVTWRAGEPVPYAFLADVFSAVEALTGRLAITAILASALRIIALATPEDLVATLYLCTNQLAPAHEGLEIGVGEATLLKALVTSTGKGLAALKADLHRVGDLGDVAAASRATQRTLMTPPKLTVRKLLAELRAVARAGGKSAQASKATRINKLLAAARGAEAKYIVRALSGKLRIHLATRTVLVALATAVTRDAPPPEPGVVDEEAEAILMMERAHSGKGLAGVADAVDAEAADDEAVGGDESIDSGSDSEGPTPVDSTPPPADRRTSAEGSTGKVDNDEELVEVDASGAKPVADPASSMATKTKAGAAKKASAAPKEGAAKQLTLVGVSKLAPGTAAGAEAVMDERIKKAVILLCRAYNELPLWESIVAALREFRAIDGRLLRRCALSPGVPVGPMLAKPTKGVSEVLDKFSAHPFTCEYKYDGERAQVHRLPDGSVHIYSRSAECTTTKYPDIVAGLPRALAPGWEDASFVLDAEAVAWDAARERVRPFQELQGRARKDVELADVKVQVCVFAFDLLYINGESLVRLPLRERRRRLREAFSPVPGVFSFAVGGDGHDTDAMATLLNDSIAAGCEGLMVKSLDGPNATYEPANRSQNWLKLKKDYMDSVGDTLDLVPIGAWYGKGKRTGAYGAYLLACWDSEADGLQSICKLGTGYSAAQITEFAAFYQDPDAGRLLTAPKSYFRVGTGPLVTPDVWLEPSQVWEVKCADLSISPQHQAAYGLVDPTKGIALRFPRLVRVRDDKKPEEATDAAQVAELYNQQSSVSR
ncbi:hypothetical protein MMPV_009090 [Pyropia vietnamensis]